MAEINLTNDEAVFLASLIQGDLENAHASKGEASLAAYIKLLEKMSKAFEGKKAGRRVDEALEDAFMYDAYLPPMPDLPRPDLED